LNREPVQLSPSGSPIRLVSNDVVLAIGLGILVAAASRAQGQDLSGAFLGASLCVPLAFRRRAPLAVLAVLAIAVPIYLLVEDPPPFFVAPAMVALYSAAAWGSRRRTLVILATLVPYLAVLVFALPTESDDGFLGELLDRIAQLALALAVGEVVRSQRAYLAAVRERADRAAQMRELEARRQLDEERVQIAQDVHDIVAHGIAAISTQASVGSHIARDDPAAAIKALDSIKEVSAQALHDLRYALKSLRKPSADGPTDPTPTIHDVSTLVDLTRTSGLPVTLRMEGSPEQLSPALQVAVYRVVQEGLANVMRHASGSRTTVRIAVREREAEVEVSDDGTGAPTATAESGSGSGLVGMRERVNVMDGTLETGHLAGGGFRVRALIPVDGNEP
jgi:signal transduction histidine kinase